VEKQRSSTHLRSGRILAVCFCFYSLAEIGNAAAPIHLSQSDGVRIGKRIWQNECNGTVAGLTSWNSGEDFASLGIGHFIWYPNGMRGPFEESFPKFLDFAHERNITVPVWLNQATACPWNSRAEFLNAQNSAQMRELRQFLAHTVDLQAQFLVARLQQSLAKMLKQMHGSEAGSGAAREFSNSAAAILRRRVQNSPPERHEVRWLPGWLNRVRTYNET